MFASATATQRRRNSGGGGGGGGGGRTPCGFAISSTSITTRLQGSPSRMLSPAVLRVRTAVQRQVDVEPQSITTAHIIASFDDDFVLTAVLPIVLLVRSRVYAIPVPVCIVSTKEPNCIAIFCNNVAAVLPAKQPTRHYRHQPTPPHHHRHSVRSTTRPTCKSACPTSPPHTASSLLRSLILRST